MNRGSALKWAERLRECEYRYQADQLGWVNGDDEIYMSPLGVLCEFIDPDGMKIDDLGFITWGGQAFYLPEYIQKKVKAKTRDMQIEGVELYDQMVGFADHSFERLNHLVDMEMAGHNSGPGLWSRFKFECAAAHIEQVYEML